MATKVTNRVMIQESRFKGETRRYEIYNNKFIKVNIHNIFGDKVYHINMDILEPWPGQYRKLSPRWMLSLAYFSLATLVFSVYLYLHQDQQTLARLVPFISLFIFLTLGSLLMFLYRSPNVYEFRTRYGACSVISFLQNKPSKKEFKTFIDELKMRVLAASQVITRNMQQMMEIELEELNRLKNQGIIHEQDCLKAQKRIKQMTIH